MNFQYKIKTNLLYNLNNTYILLNTFRNLANNTKNFTASADETKKNQLKELYIIIGALVALIIIILGGYALYRHYAEKKLIQEIEQENLYIINLENSSRNSSSQENSRPNSFNNVELPKIPNYDSEIDMPNNNNHSFDLNHEERMEKIRKKYGNSLIIKILLKQKLEEVIYNKTFKDDYGDNCTICMSNFENNVAIYKTPCEHIFHKECFNKYLKNIKNQDKLICPNCNQNLIINKKYLKLRTKAQKIDIEKEKDKLKLKKNVDKKNNDKKEINNFNEVTNKNLEIEIDDNSSTNNKETLIIVKKRKKEINSNKDKKDKKILKNNTYNKSIDLKYQNTENIKNKEDENNIDKDFNELYRKKRDKDKNIMNEKFENEINLKIQKDKIKKSKININNNFSDNNNNIQFSLNSKRDFINNKI